MEDIKKNQTKLEQMESLIGGTDSWSRLTNSSFMELLQKEKDLLEKYYSLSNRKQSLESELYHITSEINDLASDYLKTIERLGKKVSKLNS